MKKLLSTLLLTVLMFGAAAQTNTDPVIFEIGGKPIYKSQFMKEFLRSIGTGIPDHAHALATHLDICPILPELDHDALRLAWRSTPTALVLELAFIPPISLGF